MLRTTAVWNGFTGAPGYTNFYFDGLLEAIAVQGLVDKVRTFFQAARGALPAAVTVQVQQAVAQIDPANGELQNELSAAVVPAVVTGLEPGNFSSPTGACINWRTSAVVGGRRLRGRTFMIPCAGAAYEGNGTLNGGTIGTLTGAANGLISNPPGPAILPGLVVWHRPTYERTPGQPPVITEPGSTGTVASASVRDVAAILTSRRK